MFDYTHAIVRQPALSVVSGLRAGDGPDPDFAALLAEHEAYVVALRGLGLDVSVLAASEPFPDAIFVEDPALVFSEGAIVLNLAAASRAGESALIAPELASRFERVLNIKDRGQIFRVDVADIERIDAAGDYMCIYTADQTLILRETMKDLEKRLDPRKFQRIHRSTIVNLDNIKSVKPHTNGECFLVLGSNTQVKVSRSYREVVARFL